MHQLILATRHSSTAHIRVAFTSYPDAPSNDGAGINVFVDNQTGDDKLWRFYNPSEVTAWFQANSIANVEAWQAAYHTSHLKGSDFKRPPEERPHDFVLDVPCFSQRDNRLNPNGSCNVTSYAMALSYLGAKRKGSSYVQFEDELNAFLVAHNKDRHSHDDLAWMAGQYGIPAHFNTNRTLDDIRAQLRANRPVVVSTRLTSAGHIICLVGLKGSGFVANDPWGDATSSPKYSDHDGRHVLYSEELMRDKMRDPGTGGKWAHFFGGVV